MNKFTKLLSVFVIAGAVSCGVAGLAGCGPNEEAHTHSGILHEAKAATCTEVGYSQDYYTCDGADCAGKYFSDEACTQEIDLATITIAATGHTEVYTDKGNGTHGITCEHDDLTETTEAHVDADGDSKCDKCEALYFAAGKYYSEYYGEIEIKQGGTIIFNNNEYTLSAVTEDADTKALSATFSDDYSEYTLVKTETGYSIGYRSYIPVPATMAEEVAEFAGVYSLGKDYVYYYGGNYYKLLTFSITEEGKIIYSAIQVNDDGSAKDDVKEFINYVYNSNAVVKYNKLSLYPFNLTATSANAETVDLYTGYDTTNTLTLTKTADAAPVLPEGFGLTDYTVYVEATSGYQITVGENNEVILENEGLSLYNRSLVIVGGNATDGFLVASTDSSYNYINYVLKVNTADNSLGLYEADGTTLIVTLAIEEQVIPTFAVSSESDAKPTINQAALVDVFNSSYALYKIETSGWYYFNAPEKDLTIYTVVDGHDVSYLEGVIKTYAGFYSQGVELAAGDIIAVSSYYANTMIFGYVESTQQDDKYSAAFTSFDEANYGTYTYQYEAWFGWEPETVTAEIVIDANGMTHSGYTAKLVATDGTNYIVEVMGYAVKFSFDSNGNMAIASDGYTGQEDVTAVKGGSSSGGSEEEEETDTTVYVKEGDNVVAVNPKNYYQAEITLNKVGVWTVTYGDDVQYILAGTGMKLSGSTIEVTDTPIVITIQSNNLESVTVTFTLTSGSGEEISSGEETSSGLKVGDNTINVTGGETAYTFTANEAGDYVITFDNTGWVVVEGSNGAETVYSGGTLTFSAGETKTLLCSMENMSSTGTYTLTITKG